MEELRYLSEAATLFYFHFLPFYSIDLKAYLVLDNLKIGYFPFYNQIQIIISDKMNLAAVSEDEN